MRLFGRERKEEQETREAVAAMDEMVNGREEPKRAAAWITVNCVYCKAQMQQDPAIVSRFMCHECGTVINVSVEKQPNP